MLINELQQLYNKSSKEIYTSLKKETNVYYDAIIKLIKEYISDISNGPVVDYSYDFVNEGDNKLFSQLISNITEKFEADGLTVKQTAFNTYDNGKEECTLTFSGWSE